MDHIITYGFHWVFEFSIFKFTKFDCYCPVIDMLISMLIIY